MSLIKDFLKKSKSLLGLNLNKEDENKSHTPYERLGGEVVLRKLVDSFYHHMDTRSDVKECRDLHGAKLDLANEKLFMFLSGWLGGPSLYIQKYGHPRMRMRHMPFSIGEKERSQWLLCMREAMNEASFEPSLDQEIWQAFRRFSEHMKNKD